MNFLRWQEVMGTLFLVLDWWVLTRCFDKLIPSPASNRKTFVRLQRPHSQPPGSLQSLPQDGEDSQYKERRRPATPGFWRSENACDCSHLAGVRFLHPADQTRAGREWGEGLVGLELRKLSCCQNQHWSLYSSHCSPCLANYTYILHQEDRREQELLLNITGISDLVGGNNILNPTRGGNTSAVMQVNIQRCLVFFLDPTYVWNSTYA